MASRSTPHWIDGGDTFWYRTTRQDGVQFVKVDPETGTREPAFDHVRLAAALSAASGIAYDPRNLPLAEIEFADGGQQLQFDARRGALDVRPDDLRLPPWRAIDEPPAADASRSPDGQWDVFVREHNLWLRAVETGEERALTEDGEPGYGYGATLASPLVSAGLAEPEKPVAIWSPDSRRFVSCRIDQRQAQLPPPRPVGAEGWHHPAAAAHLRLSAPRRRGRAAGRGLVLRRRAVRTGRKPRCRRCRCSTTGRRSIRPGSGGARTATGSSC